MILHEYVTFKGEVVPRSGLRVGGSGGQLEIGAVDNTIIRDPLTRLPYIPGSSLKGKMRSGLEALKQNFNRDERPQNNEPCGCGKCLVCRVFGPYQNTRSNAGPTRLLVRDLHLTPEAQARYRQAEQEGVSAIEEKMENLINRQTRAATNPRTSERVAPGLAFELQLVLRVFEPDNHDELVGVVRQALALVEVEGLGSSVSRGYGQVEIRDLRVTTRRAADVRLPDSV